MKYSIVLFSILISHISFGQDNANKTKEKKSESAKFNFYVGIGVHQQSNLNLNNRLSPVGLPKINQVQPEFTFGLNMIGKKYVSDIEIATSYSNTELIGNRNEFISTTGRLRFHSILKSTKKTLLSAGGNIAYAGSSVNLFSLNNTIDLNNLNNNVNHLSLRNGMIYVGPSLSFYAFRKSTFPIRLSLGYEFALTRGRWRSDYADVNNTIGEFGKNRLMFGIAIM
jgi:hypothetical protein